MPLHLHPEPLPEGPALRSLVLAALESLLGPVTVVEASLPAEGGPALVLDGEGRPTLVSFDPRDTGRALLAGLAALEAVSAAGPWLAGRHPALAGAAALDHLQLLALGPTAPAGLARAGMPARVRVCTMRALRVGNDTGLLLEPLSAPVPDPASDRPPNVPPEPGPLRPFRSGWVTLTAEEEAFFERV